MTPVSERAIAIFVARLQEITLANEYNTDAGTRVFRAKRSPDIQDCPCIVVWDDGESTGEGAGNHRAMLMEQRVVVVGHVVADTEEGGQMAGLLKADIKRAILSAGELEDADGKIGTITYRDCTTSAREDGAATEFLAANFTATYKEVRGNPYSTKVIRE